MIFAYIKTKLKPADSSFPKVNGRVDCPLPLPKPATIHLNTRQQRNRQNRTDRISSAIVHFLLCSRTDDGGEIPQTDTDPHRQTDRDEKHNC